jgi:predicted aspartyl protease
VGVFYVDGEVAGIAAPTSFVPVSQMLVDTGSEFTWISEAILRQAGVTVAKQNQPFLMANGSRILRETGYALLRASGFETVDEVVFGQPGDLALLGARTLEGFGAVVDASRRRLAAAGPHLAAALNTGVSNAGTS